MRTSADFALEAIENDEQPTPYLETMTKAELAFTVCEAANLAGLTLDGWDAAEFEEAAAAGDSINIGQDGLAGLVEAFADVAQAESGE